MRTTHRQVGYDDCSIAWKSYRDAGDLWVTRIHRQFCCKDLVSPRYPLASANQTRSFSVAVAAHAMGRCRDRFTHFCRQKNQESDRCRSKKLAGKVAMDRQGLLKGILSAEIARHLAEEGQPSLPELLRHESQNHTKRSFHFNGAKIVLVTVLVVVGFGPAGCGRTSTAKIATAPTPVTVSHPIQREVADYADFTSRTAAVESVEVRARVGGYLDKINFKEGTLVKKGDLLFED